jgi:hypothetical protein
MATKPTSTPRWANVGGDIVEPNAGKKDIGWAAGERPPAQYKNWLLNLAWQWFEYLSDGVFTGLARFVDGLHLGDGTPGVRLETNNTDELTIRNEADSADGDIRFGDMAHGPRGLMLPPCAGSPFADSGMTYVNEGPLLFVTGTGAWLIPIPLHVGDRLIDVTVYVVRNGATITMNVVKRNGFGTETVLGTDTATVDGNDILTVFGVNDTVTVAESFAIRLTWVGGTDTTVRSTIISYDRP